MTAAPLRRPLAEPLRGMHHPEHAPVREMFPAHVGPTPLRRPLAMRRRRRSGVAALLAGAAVRALLVVALPVGIVVWLLYSPYFLIREVKVDGGARVSAAWVEENLRPLVGRHVLAVSLEGVRQRLSAHPWVASVELRRELPDRLRVTVLERRPVALLAEPDGGKTFLDGAGLPIAPCPAPGQADPTGVLEPGRAHGLLTVRDRFAGAVPVQAALDVVAELRRAQPTWGLEVREIEVLGEGEYRVTTAALDYPLLLKRGTVEEAVTNLQLMLPEISRRVPAVALADLRSPRRLVIQPQPGAPKPNKPGRDNESGNPTASGNPTESTNPNEPAGSTASTESPR
ncbi:MAG TPA: FtsQ-type POTRA domain-containing protein [Thermoanaerobaculia bacterium]|nr:FtsQ-type POTRA domain-containing protein [Thermoanaerobaculia bacterium]